MFDPLLVVIKGLAGELAVPFLLLWLIVGWGAPFLMLSAVLSLRRIARALERLAAAGADERQAAPGAVLGVERITPAS